MSLTPEQIAYQEAHIDQNRGPGIIITSSIFGALALIALGLRLFHRVRKGTGLGLDDYLMIAATVTTLLEMADTYVLISLGIGKHVVAVPPGNFVALGKWIVVGYFTYPLAITLVKFSILALIWRVFRLNKPYKIAVWIIVVYTFLWLLGSYLAIGLYCKPFSSYWSLTAPCNLPPLATIVETSLDIVSDLAIAILPQPLIWGLNLSTRNKIMISLLLSLGIFCSVTGAVRIAQAKQFDTVDPTYGGAAPIIFVILELQVAIIVGCMPPAAQSTLAAYMSARHWASLQMSSLNSRIRSIRSSRSQISGAGSGSTSDMSGPSGNLGSRGTSRSGDVESHSGKLHDIESAPELRSIFQTKTYITTPVRAPEDAQNDRLGLTGMDRRPSEARLGEKDV